MNNQQFSKVFPLGTHLCREPMPAMSEMKKDMENIRRHGFNLVKLQENWMVDEPLEGQVNLSRYEELIEYAARLDLGVYLGLTCEQAPTWLYRKHPGCRMVGRNGLPIAYEAQTTLPADGKPGPCYDHPGALADEVRFIQTLVSTLGKYENIVVWNTWQEIGYWSEGLAGQPVCYCENTMAAYRRWLEEKYADLDTLNREWNTRYGDWSYISPDRGAYKANALPQDVDWRYFMDNVQVAHVLRTRYQAIKSADPRQRPVFAHKGSPIAHAGQDWTYARCQDFLGSSCYPAWNPFHAWDDGAVTRQDPQGVDRETALRAEMWNGVAIYYDVLRSASVRGNPVWAAEFQGGPVSTFFHKGRVPQPADIRRWMLTAVGCGVTAISFWVTRAEIMAQETNGFSLLDSTGDTTPRYEEAVGIGAALNRHADLFGAPSWGGAQVAIVVNEWNHQFTQSLQQGGENLAFSVRGWHRLLWDAGIPVDFVEASQLDEDFVKEYKALVVPFPLSMSEDVANSLAHYVEQGGNLISEAAPGRINEHGNCTRGEVSPTLARAFGVTQTGFTMVREPGGERRWSPLERTWGEYLPETMLQGTGPLANLRLRANVYIETLECQGSTPILMKDGAVTGVVNGFGKGQAWLLGTYVGHSGNAYREDESPAFVRALLVQCGVEPLHKGKLLARLRTIPGKRALLLTNPTGEPLTETVATGPGHVEDLLGGKLEPAGDSVSLTVDGLDVRILVITD
jgi:beta-galactosidase